MRTRPSLLPFLTGLLALTLAACGGGAATPTPTRAPTAAPQPAAPSATPRPTTAPQPTAAPQPTVAPQPSSIPTPELSGVVEVTNLSYYQEGDSFTITGLVVNGTAEGISSVDLVITAADDAGNPVITDWSGAVIESATDSPELFSIASGMASPFEYTFRSEAGELAEYNVAIDGYDPSDVTPQPLMVVSRLVQTAYPYVVGEIINTGDEPVLLSQLYATIMTDAGEIRGVAFFPVYCDYLAPAGQPGDRIPFVGAPNNADDSVTQVGVYYSAAVYESHNFDIIAETTATYRDADDNYHIVGMVTNNEDRSLDIRLVGGVYDAAGLVINTATSPETIRAVGAGETMPFDLMAGDNMFAVDMDGRMAGAIASSSVHTCQGSHTTVYDPALTLATEEDMLEVGDTSVTVSGLVVNDSAEELEEVEAIVAVFDANDTLIATARSGALEAPDGQELFAAGDGAAYAVTVDLPLDIDPESVDVRVMSLGYFAN
jgi:hypothetical protein